MAPAHEDNPNSYGGLGAGGKFRKHTSRRSANSKPYDRPPTALRSHINGDGRPSGGWLAKLVDPAQRLISASAHRLFASVFRKRLPPPPPPPPTQSSPPPSEPCKETRDERMDGVSSPKRAQVKPNGGNSIGNSDSSGAIKLEQTLKQMTFTRSEINRLTAMLNSRTSDMPSEHEEKRPEMTPSKLLSCEGNSRLENTPVPARKKGVESHLASTPAVNQSVLDEDVVSPTELAKAYMGSRISRASFNVLGGRSQASKDDTILCGNRHILQKSPATSVVPMSSGPASASTNSLITPRFRGRSAIYSMARTPYARVNPRSTLKDAGIPVDIARPTSSVSLSIWEQNKLSASRQGSLKRRSSVLDNDIRSVGPIRRIRQKPNLLSSTSLIQPASATSMSASRTVVGADASQHPSSPVEKLPSSIKPKFKLSLGNGENCTSATNFARVPTKSSEMASKILQQLDKLVSPKEKTSPTQLSPSMLSGKALGSLEKVDSSRFMVNVQDYSKVDPSSMSLPASNDSNSPKVNKIEQNGPQKLHGLPGRVTSPANVLDTSVSAKDTALTIKSADTAAKKSNAYNQQKKRAFQMCAPDVSLDWDDEGHPDGAALSTPAEDSGKKKASDSDNKIFSSEAITIQQLPSASDIKTSETSNTGIPDGTLAAVKNAAFTFPSASSTAADKVASSAGPDAASSTPIFSFGDVRLHPTESNVTPIFSFGDKITPVKEVNAVASTIISSDSKNIDSTPLSLVPGQSGQEAGALPTSKIETSNRLATTSAGMITEKHPESETANQNSNPLPASPSTSAAGIFLFGASSNGSFATTTFSSTISSASPSNITSQSASDSSAFTASIPGSTSTDQVTGITVPSLTSSSSTSPGLSTFSSVPAIKLGSATVPSTMSSTVAVNPIAELNNKTKHDTSFSNLSSSPFSSTSLGANTGSSIFGLAPVTSMTPNNSSQGSAPFSSSFGVTTSSPFAAQASSSRSGMVTCSQSKQNQVDSSVSSPSFGLWGNSSFSSSSSLFGSSNGSTVGQNSLSTSAEAKSGSSGGVTADMSTTTLQPGKSPIFGSTSSTNGFAFGASTGSSTPAGASNAAPVVFGSSDNSLPSSSFVSVTSSSTLVQPTFGNSPSPSQPVVGNLSASSQPTFGNPSASRLAFGNSSASSQSPFASNSAASLQLAFGGTSPASLQSAFGSTSAASSQPIFGGSSAASQSIVGGTSPASQPIFGATSPLSQPIFGGTSSASQPIFGGTSSASQPIFGGTSTAFGPTPASSQPAFGNTSTSSQPAFGNHNSGFPFGLASSGHNDRMSMEDTMAEDSVHSPASAPAPAPSTSVFGQQSFSAQQTGFVFGSTAQSGLSPFQFGSQQNLSTQNPSPFHAGGSFSLGSGGGDKSKRKIIKVKHKGRK